MTHRQVESCRNHIIGRPHTCSGSGSDNSFLRVASRLPGSSSSDGCGLPGRVTTTANTNTFLRTRRPCPSLASRAIGWRDGSRAVSDHVERCISSADRYIQEAVGDAPAPVPSEILHAGQISALCAIARAIDRLADVIEEQGPTT